MTEFQPYTIYYGIEPESGKWKAQFKLPNGEFHSTTQGYDTLEELRKVVETWLIENNIPFRRAN